VALDTINQTNKQTSNPDVGSNFKPQLHISI